MQKQNTQNRIRIKLESFDKNLLNEACQIIKKSITDKTANVIGPIRLPTKKRIYCVLKSPHVNKDAREHFEIRIHKQIFDIYPMYNDDTALIKVNLPAGVNTTILF